MNSTLKPGRPQLEQVRKKKKMKRQRNTAQMKEQGRNQDQINEEEISNLPEKEFRIMIVKMFQSLENRMEKMQETQLTHLPRT